MHVQVAANVSQFYEARESVFFGRFELAAGGTLFLDEVFEIPIENQADFLRVLEDFRFARIGGNQLIEVDVRIVSATNNDLKEKIKQGLFREDLFYRLHVVPLHIPPLRERGNDILLIADFFLHKYASKYDKDSLKISNRASKKLMKYSWPGNVRELQHCIEKAVILTDDKLLDHNSFSLDNNTIKSRGKLQFQTIEDMEREMILDRINEEKGNMSIVAKKLGITRQTLYNKLKKYDL